MATAWDHRDPRRRDRERSRALATWLRTEVRPFSAFWRQRLSGVKIASLRDLAKAPTLTEHEAAGASLAFWGLYHMGLATRLAALHPRRGADALEAPLRRSVAVLPPTVVAAPGGEAAATIEALGEIPGGLDHLRTILWVGDPPSETDRVAAVERASALAGRDVRVQAVWAPESARALWGEPRPAAADPAEATYGLATYPDLEVVEVRDPHGDVPVAEGEAGELVHTSLGWRGTATVRLATGAWTGGLVTSVPCPRTGRTVPRLAPWAVAGAWQPRVAGGDGRPVRVDLRGVETALADAGAADTSLVRDWSLRVDDGELVLALDTGGGRDVVLGLADAVAKHTGVAPRVSLDPQAAARRPRIGTAGPR